MCIPWPHPDGTVFYVGKGSGRRIDQHEADARQGIVSKKCDIIRAIWERGEELVKTKVHDGLSEDEAYHREKVLIRKHGIEALANQVEGISGAPFGNGNAIGHVNPRRGKKGLAAMMSLPHSVSQPFKEAAVRKAGRALTDEECIALWRDLDRRAVQTFIEQQGKQ